VIPKDKNHGATWAFEVANQTMVCPIIVEDMNPPGQMLIEVRSRVTMSIWFENSTIYVM
jgi:hypothetical protein